MIMKKMPARVESLHELLTFIRAEAKKRGFSESALNRIELVAEEALVNVFVHGYAKGQGIWFVEKFDYGVVFLFRRFLDN